MVVPVGTALAVHTRFRVAHRSSIAQVGYVLARLTISLAGRTVILRLWIEVVSRAPKPVAKAPCLDVVPIVASTAHSARKGDGVSELSCSERRDERRVARTRPEGARCFAAVLGRARPTAVIGDCVDVTGAKFWALDAVEAPR